MNESPHPGGGERRDGYPSRKGRKSESEGNLNIFGSEDFLVRRHMSVWGVWSDMVNVHLAGE